MIDNRPPGRRSALGRIDPFCWVAVSALLLAAVALGFFKAVALAIVMVCLAIALAVFDSWVNRSAPPRRDRDELDEAPRTRAARRVRW